MDHPEHATEAILRGYIARAHQIVSDEGTSDDKKLDALWPVLDAALWYPATPPTRPRPREVPSSPA